MKWQPGKSPFVVSAVCYMPTSLSFPEATGLNSTDRCFGTTVLTRHSDNARLQSRHQNQRATITMSATPGSDAWSPARKICPRCMPSISRTVPPLGQPRS
jgi:hypothetical protein